MKESFSPQTAKALGHYVYALSYPYEFRKDDQGIFYVGKGVGQRCFSHADLVENAPDFPKQKETGDLKKDIIREILDAGFQPHVQIVAHGLRDDDHALQIEAILIEAFGLTNKQSGHHARDYWQSSNQLEERYGTPIYRQDIPGNVLLVGLNRSYAEASGDPEKLKYATLGDWGLAPQKGKQVDYIIGVHRGLMVSFYKTTKSDGECVMWQTNIDGRRKRARRRYRWEASRAEELEVRFRDRALVAKDSSGDRITLSILQRNTATLFLPETQPN